MLLVVVNSFAKTYAHDPPMRATQKRASSISNDNKRDSSGETWLMIVQCSSVCTAINLTIGTVWCAPIVGTTVYFWACTRARIVVMNDSGHKRVARLLSKALCPALLPRCPCPLPYIVALERLGTRFDFQEYSSRGCVAKRSKKEYCEQLG